MKKYISLVLVLCMLLALTGCGKDAPETTATGTEPTSTTEPTGTEPTGTEPTVTEPSATDPTETEPAVTEPAQTETTPKPTACSHSWKDATCAAPKTCSKCGATEGSKKTHSWKDATCTAPKTCSVCKATEGGTKGHNWSDATCTAPKTCTKCSATEGSTKGHSWNEATCTAPKTCSVCKATEGSAKGHSWKNATCTDPKVCGTCKTVDGEALGHSYIAGICSVCKEYKPNYKDLKTGAWSYTILEESDPDDLEDLYYYVFVFRDTKSTYEYRGATEFNKLDPSMQADIMKYDPEILYEYNGERYWSGMGDGCEFIFNVEGDMITITSTYDQTGTVTIKRIDGNKLEITAISSGFPSHGFTVGTVLTWQEKPAFVDE